MATVWITEYERPLIFNGAAVPVGDEPSIVVQKIAFSTSMPSAPLNAKTRFIRLKSDGNMHFKFGADSQDTPTATTDDTPVDAGVVEYFGAPAGFRIAFVEA